MATSNGKYASPRARQVYSMLEYLLVLFVIGSLVASLIGSIGDREITRMIAEAEDAANYANTHQIERNQP
jgi:type II secretory pathway pseudopilin PulG